MREYWERIKADDFAVPDDRPLPELFEDLCDGLASPDPDLRDGAVFPVLATWVSRGVFDTDPRTVGDRMAVMLRAEEIQARTFATLVLAALIERDNEVHNVDGTDAHRWFVAFAEWWVGESDLRGWDDSRGWLHAVAHGADTLAAYGASRHLGVVGLRDLLDTVRRRLVAGTDHVWDAQEDDRVALACAVVLARPELSAEDAVDWLSTLTQTLRERAEPGPVPAVTQNSLHTVKALYLLVNRGFRFDDREMSVPHREAVEDSLVEVLTVGWSAVA